MKPVAGKLFAAMPLISASAFFIAACVFGWSRDFGVFLLGLFGLPVLLVAVLVCFVLVAAYGDARRNIGIGFVLLLAAPFGSHAASRLHDPIRFLGWKIAHAGELRELASRDRVIAGWESWGMAGSESFSYLVSDTRDDSATAASAERWRKRMGLECEIVDAQRMQRRLYIVTTYECVFNGIPVPD